MALSTRDLYLVLRARDEASRVLRGFSREILQTGAAARVAAARANAAATRQAITAAQAAGATAAQIAALRASAQAWDAEATRIARAAAARQRFSNIMQTTSQALITSGVVLAAVGAGTLMYLADAVKFASEYERQVRLTLTQVNDLNKSVQEIGDIGKRVARQVGVAFENIQPALYDIFSSTNANMKQAEILLLGFSKAAVAGQVDIQDASRATIAIMNAFNVPLEEVNDVLDVQFQLVKYGVGTYAEFAKVFGNVLPSAARAGQSFQTIAAMLAFMTRNGMSAAMAATSAARALEAMSHPKTLERLKQMGIETRDAAGNMRPMTEVLRDLRSKLDGLPGPEKVAKLVELLKGAGGTIQARRFLEQVLLRPGELEELEFYLKQMDNASGAFEDAYGTMADSVSVKTELLKNKWKSFKADIGAAVVPGLLQLMDMLGRVMDFFNNLSPGTKNAIAQFMLWGSVAGILGGALLVFLGILAGVVAAVVAAGSGLFIVIGAFIDLGLIVAGTVAVLTQLWNSSEVLRTGIANLRSAFQELRDKIMEIAGPIAETIRSTFGQRIVETFRVLGDVFGTFINWIAGGIRDYLVPWLGVLKQYWDANQNTIKPLLNLFGQVVKWVAIIVGAIVGLIAVIGVGGLIAVIMAVVGVFIFIIEVIRRVVAAVRTIIAIIGSLIGSIGGAANAFRNFGSAVSNVIGQIPGIVKNAFSDAGAWLMDAGRNIINGLVNGIKGAIGAVKAALGAVTSMIPSWKGPKAKDLKLLRPTGQWLMKGLARGIQEGSGLVKSTLSGFTNDFGRDQGFGRAPRPPDAPMTNRTQTINVYTQEIDPRKTAAQLGWELQGAY